MNTLEFLSFVYLADWVVPFIKEHHPKWREEPEEKLCEYLGWYAGKSLLAIDFQGQEVYGVCTIKLFDQLSDFLEPKAFNPTGKFCMVDLLVATSPLAIAHCFEILFGRWGRQEIMLWDRDARTEEGAPRMYTWEKYMKLTKRLTYGLV